MKKRIFACVVATAMLCSLSATLARGEEAVTVGALAETGTEQRAFSSVKDAFAFALKAEKNTDVVVTLMSDWDVGATLSAKGYVIPEGATLSLDLYGFKINGTKGNGRLFYVSENATLNISDSRPENTRNTGAIKGGIIAGFFCDDEGGAVYLDSGAALKMTGGAFAGCASEDEGGAIFAEEGAKVNLSGTGFYTNISYNDAGGAVYSDGGTLRFADCFFEGNSAADEGGALYIDGDGTATLTGCTFRYNTAGENGGGICADGDGGTTLKNNIFLNNTAKEKGGGLFVNGDRVYLNGGKIAQNTASQQGGGVYVDSLYDINCGGNLVIENNTDKEGKSDLCLQSGLASTAYMNCGGFTPGAHVGVDIADDSNAVVCREMSIFQYKNYLFADRGKLTFSKEKVIAENFVSTAIGKGSVKGIILVGVLLIAISFAVPYSVKKRRRSEDDEEK